ncbi:MAG: SPOCS domain-containing protein [Velocimicrobium sp.]
MELFMQKINMSQKKNRSDMQITLDDDFNVTDSKPDIDKVVKEQGTIIIQEITPMNDRFMIKGALLFNLLYISQESKRPVHNMSGEIPFEESVNMEGITGEEVILCNWELEDMSIALINSRKINVRAIIRFDFCAENTEQESVVTGVEEDDLHYIKDKFNLTQTVISKKDTFRIKDEVSLPMGKDNVSELLYSNMELLEGETKVMEDRIAVRGVLRVFVLYIGENENRGIEFYETDVPINGNVECIGANDSMVLDVDMSLNNKDIQMKPDEDGEERILDIEAVINLTIKLYQEDELEILKDIYSTKSQLDIQRKNAEYKNLLMKNNSKLRVVDTLKLEDGQKPILQICNGSASVKIDEEHIVENGILVDGIVSVQVLYITEEDARPVGAVRGDIPFTHTIEIKDINKDSSYEIKSCIDQLSLVLVDETEIEVKATVCLEAIVFNELKQDMILSVDETGSLEEVRKTFPSIVGYIVKSGDTLWDIAKAFYTTKEEIEELNELDSERLSEGQKLIICK